MKVSDVMATNVVTVQPGALLKDVAQIFVDRRISGVPVVGSAGEVLGVVSERDILEKECHPSRRPGRLRALLSRRTRRLAAKQRAQTAREAMTSPAITISRYASVADAASTMIDRDVDRLVAVEYAVQGGEPRLAGIVTRSDLVRAFARDDDEIEREIRTLLERDFGLAPHEVRLTVVRGRVTLDGEVDLRDTADALRALVAIVPGVTDLRSRLTWRIEEVTTERALI